MENRRLTKERADQIAGGVFLIGLAILFTTSIGFWPGILFVIGASSLARGMAEGREWYSVQGALWMIGLGLFFAVGFSLPLLLIVIGLSMLFGWRFRPPFIEGHDEDEAAADLGLSEEKPKRKLKRAEGLAYYEEGLPSSDAADEREETR
ncbi:MAG: hypothetical protein HPY64_09115 [Anaerolineae bacterium]|nr:hypothetical protein [Anaerolineae bacterium]